MRLNKKLLIFPYTIIIIISILFLIKIYPILLYILYSLAGYPGGIRVIQEIFRILVYTIRDLLLGLILSIAMIGIIKYFNKEYKY